MNIICFEQPKTGRRMMAEKLKSGDVFPSLSLNIVGGGEFLMPEELESSITIALFFRGHW